MRTPKALVSIALIAILLSSCGDSNRHDTERMKQSVEAFAVAYFNYHLQEAATHCTEDSHGWLRFVASNLTEDDLEVLRHKDGDATVHVEDCHFDEATATGKAKVCVRNVMVADTIGRPGRIAEKAVYELDLVLFDGQYLIRMASLPQSGM